MSGQNESVQNKKGFFSFIERVGNKLPDPVFLFIIVSICIVLLSFVGKLLGWGAIHPTTKAAIETYSLLSADGIRKMMTNFPANIRGFTPITDQLVVLIGLALIEGTGLISAFMRKFLINAPKKYVTFAVVFVGVSSSIASDAGFLVLPPLAAMLFLATGRNPLVGMIAAYGSVAAGFSSSFFIGIVEVIGFGLTESAARIVDPNISITITSNYYFTFICSILLPITAFIMTVKVVEPMLGEYKPEPGMPKVVLEKLTPGEARAMRFAGIAALIYVAIILLMVVPSWGILRNPETGEIIRSPFMSSILLIVTGFFFFPGLVYGISTKVIQTHRDPIRIVVQSYAGLGGYILVGVFTAQLIKYFEWSNLGIISAINGADFFQRVGAPPFVMILIAIIFTMVLNLFMPSHAGKLGFIAPVFVPMFMFMGISPEASYLAYRIGDSVSNAVTPMMPYFIILLGFAQKYKKDTGIGTLVANLLPYSIAFFVVYVLLFFVFYMFNLPIGPGATIHM